ncbi:MAG: Hsp20/alpha crystallin family protein [Candidatus Cybelea sp.]|jgi:HSP20 family protein
MATLEKKEYNELQAVFGRMLPEFSVFEFQAPRFAQIRPSLDLYETDKRYVLELAAPGYEPKDIKVEVSGHTVTIWGFYTVENRPYRYHYREIPRGSFTRVVTLPQELDPEKVDAKFENGILTIALWPMKPLAFKEVEIKTS